MRHVWEDTKEFVVSFRGAMVTGVAAAVWAAVMFELLRVEPLWLRIAVGASGLFVVVGVVGVVKMWRPTPRWESEVDRRMDSLSFDLHSLRDQSVVYVELIVIRPDGQRHLVSDRAGDVITNMTFFHQYPHGFTNQGAAEWLVPGRYGYEWSVRYAKDEPLVRVARGSCLVAAESPSRA
ncbi:MAG: hypothetical protein WD895_06580 [Acidimicrobiia bacterium]